MNKTEFITELGLRKVRNWIISSVGAGLVALTSYFGHQFLQDQVKNREAIQQNAIGATEVRHSIENLTLALDKNTEIQKIKEDNITKRIDKLENKVEDLDKKLDTIITNS